MIARTTMNWEQDASTGDLLFSGRVRHLDLAMLDLDRLDLVVLASPTNKASGILQSLEIIYRRMEEQCPKNCVLPIEWLPVPPPAPGAYVVTAAIEGRKRQASICHWDGKLFQHWSGFYDHAITHYMPTDLPEGPRK